MFLLLFSFASNYKMNYMNCLGSCIINLKWTWEKLLAAARAIVAIDNPADVIAISADKHGQRAVLKFSKYTGCNSIAGRFTPGTFTNHTQVCDFSQLYWCFL